MGRIGLSALLVTTTEGFFLDDQLIQAYRNTEYRVQGHPPFTIRIGLRCPPADALLSARGLTDAAFLTAWNPYSQPTSAVENAAAQDRLAAHLTSAGLAYLQGQGVGEDGNWAPEPSFLILGISRKAAGQLSRDFGQNAYVHIRHGEPAELILTHL